MSVYIILCFHAPVVANAFSSHRSSKSLSHNRCSGTLHRISNGALQMYCHTKHVEIPHVSKIPKVHANASGIRAWHPLKWKCKGFCFEAAHDKDEYILQTNISGFKTNTHSWSLVFLGSRFTTHAWLLSSGWLTGGFIPSISGFDSLCWFVFPGFLGLGRCSLLSGFHFVGLASSDFGLRFGLGLGLWRRCSQRLLRIFQHEPEGGRGSDCEIQIESGMGPKDRSYYK